VLKKHKAKMRAVVRWCKGHETK